MTIEIVNFPIKIGGPFRSYVKLPEGSRGYVVEHFAIQVPISVHGTCPKSVREIIKMVDLQGKWERYLARMGCIVAG